MQRLQGIHFEFVTVLHAHAGRMGASQRGEVHHPTHQRLSADGVGILHSLFVFNDVDDEVDVAVFDHIDDVRTAFLDLIDHRYRDAGRLDGLRGAARSHNRKAHPSAH
ncbi:MAG: hypothetical protein H6R08_184 [Proteobacteria bacterium]|nr:hypothetical protein [Pseudomonadota bacterium]